MKIPSNFLPTIWKTDYHLFLIINVLADYLLIRISSSESISMRWIRQFFNLHPSKIYESRQMQRNKLPERKKFFHQNLVISVQPTVNKFLHKLKVHFGQTKLSLSQSMTNHFRSTEFWKINISSAESYQKL